MSDGVVVRPADRPGLEQVLEEIRTHSSLREAFKNPDSLLQPNKTCRRLIEEARSRGFLMRTGPHQSYVLSEEGERFLQSQGDSSD